MRANRWAAVFVTVLGEHAAEGLACLKALVQPVKTISGALFGYSAARRLEQLLRESAAGVGTDVTIEYAIRFITLLVARNQFKYIDMILQKIEERIDKHTGTLAVTIESATPLDSVFEQELMRRIVQRTGAANIKMKTRMVPALLGGYRLRAGGLYVDASVKGQMDTMQADLEAAL